MDFEGYKTTTAPATEPVTVTELGAQLRLGSDEITEQTAMLGDLITAARGALERVTYRAFINRTITQTFCEFSDKMDLLYPPLNSVTSVKYYDDDNTLQTLDSSVYLVDTFTQPGSITLGPNQSWPGTEDRTNAVQIEYVAGYGSSAEDVPQEARQTIIALAVDMYEHPEANAEVMLRQNPTYKFVLDTLTMNMVF